MDGVYAHFIGIGGAGMSGLAQVLHERGVRVTGSDLRMSRYAEALAEAGVPVFEGHAAANLGEPEVVVVSSAIRESNPELQVARERGIPVWPRAKMLAHLAGDLSTIAVAGTHGKTTTSSMVASCLSTLGLDPTFLIGGELNDMGSNARSGSGEHYVVEADESDGSFLYLRPTVALVTNIEADHLDHYGSVEDIERIFAEFLAKVDERGSAVLCADDPRVMALASGCRGRVVTYGETEGADLRLHSVERDGVGHRFKISLPDGSETACATAVPGIHNVFNATGAVAAAYCAGVDASRVAGAMASFTGVRRRFERVGEVSGVTVVDDYAHHPTEVKATLAAAADAGFERVWVVFQPHRFSRTAALGHDFGASFEDADRVILMDVYGAGEVPIPGVSGRTVLEALLDSRPRSRVAYFPHRADIEPYVVASAAPGDLVLTMGAGDVTGIARDLVRGLERKAEAGA